MGCCLTSSSDPCGGTTWVFWLGHWWPELPKAYKVSPTGWHCRMDAKEKVPEILTKIHRLLFQIPQRILTPWTRATFLPLCFQVLEQIWGTRLGHNSPYDLGNPLPLEQKSKPSRLLEMVLG